MTIKEIAKLAGVSNAAVSRYLNNGYVSDEKKEAIRTVIEQTGFVPSAHAQMLRSRKTRLIGVIPVSYTHLLLFKKIACQGA